MTINSGIRLDGQLSASDSLFGRYTNYESDLFRPGIGPLAGNVFPYSGRNVVVQETHIFSPALLNTFKFGYNRANVFNSWEITPTSLANEIGLKINQVPEEYGLPSVALSGGWYVGGGTGINQGGIDNLFQFSDTISWIRGAHTLKFGADIRYIRFDQRLGLNNNGAFTFDDRYTGNPVSDFLFGNSAQMTAQIGLGVGRWRSQSYNFFVADDWKISPRLTLNIGLRYEYDSPYAEKRWPRRLLRHVARKIRGWYKSRGITDQRETYRDWSLIRTCAPVSGSPIEITSLHESGLPTG